MASAGPPEVSVELRLEPEVIPFHKQAVFSIVVEAPDGTPVDLPDMRGRFGELQVSGTPGYVSESLEGGRVRRTVSYVLDAVFVGSYAIEPVTVRWGGGEEMEHPSPSLLVRELTPEEEADALRFEGALAEPEFGGAHPVRRWAAWAAGLAAALVAALAALRWWRRPRLEAGAAPRTPWEIAQERLRVLSARRWPQAGRIEAYYVELSDILRDYVENRFHVHAPELTTPEFLDEISVVGVLTEEHEALLAGFLRHCDRVKFAQYRPTRAEMQGGFATVSGFVTETIPLPDDAGEEAAA